MRQRLPGVRHFACVGFILLAALGAASPALSDPLPTCALNLGAGQPTGFEQLRGKVLYVDFWASWCVPCLLSFPFMNDLQVAYGSRGLQVIAVNMDQKPADAEGFLAKHPARFTVAAGPNGPCAKALGVAAMPSSFLVDRNGNIHSRHAGFRADDAAQLRAEVEALLSEKAAQ